MGALYISLVKMNDTGRMILLSYFKMLLKFVRDITRIFVVVKFGEDSFAVPEGHLDSI